MDASNSKNTFEIKTTNVPPYNANVLAIFFAKYESPEQITSLPSPIAPEHLVNTAFFAANAYKIENSNSNIYIDGTGKFLYDKQISHCLDIFELLFYWDELNLDRKKFLIESFSLPSAKYLDEKSESSDVEKKKHINFRTTFDLYLKRYKSTLENTGDAFDCGFYIKYNNEIIAITSPLTGFFISASVDFGQNGIEMLKNGKEEVFLSNDKATFRPLAKRDMDFRIFLCKLINTDDFCPRSYSYFKDYVKEYAKDFEKTEEYKSRTEKIDLSKYGFNKVPQIDLIKGAVIVPDINDGKEKRNTENVIAIPDRYNKIYFRSLLDVKRGVSFNLTAADYKEKLEDRMLLGQNTKWLSVNDFFQNDIIELDDAINTDRFYCCKVIDENGNQRDVKVLLPLKESFFEFFNYDKNDVEESNQLFERLEVKMVSKEKYVATLKVPTQCGDVILSKEYLLPKKNAEGKIGKPESSIIRLSDDYDSLYLGIYPFVKDTVNKNNNGFFRVFTYHSKKMSSELKFYKDTNIGLSVIENIGDERYVTSKSYGKGDANFPISTFYALEKRYFDNDNAFNFSVDKDVDFEVVKISLKKDKGKYQALLIPKFISKECTGVSGMLSVDFGTSNTNISIGTDGAAKKVSDYDSHISNEKSQQVSQIVMLHKPKNNKFDFEASPFGAINQNHLLSEFMPAIISKDHKDYKFALPSVINLHEDKMDNKSVSLVHANIPVAYYSKGLRKMNDTEIDKPFANFKWTENNKQKELYVYLFIDQLLLMARNMLLASQQNPQNVIVVYSTPLSMKDTELLFYNDLWNALANKYFNAGNLHKISESRAPYYASGLQFGANSTVLLDIGGGSTDILFYQNQMIKATTSYAYAANGLFAGAPNENIFLKQMPLEASTKKEQDMNEVEENTTMSVCDIFNYRFSQKEYKVKKQFIKSDEWKYLLTLHCSALLYHVIQNNKAIIGNDIPLRNILFSGNGAKLFKLLNGIDANNDKLVRLAKKIVKYIYKQKSENPLDISFVDDNWVNGVTLDSRVGMKASTSIGSICWQMNLKNDAGQVSDPKVVPIGDEASYLKTVDLTNQAKRKELDANDPIKQKIIIGKVSKNFEKFLEGFLGKEGENDLFDCGLRAFVSNPIDGKIVRQIIAEKDLIRTSIEDYHLKYPIPEHSIFLVPLQQLIIELSKYFACKP